MSEHEQPDGYSDPESDEQAAADARFASLLSQVRLAEGVSLKILEGAYHPFGGYISSVDRCEFRAAFRGGGE